MTIAAPAAASADATTPDTPPADPGARPGRHPAHSLLTLTGGLAAVLVALLALFILPSLKSGPRDLPLGLVGTADAVTAAQAGLDQLAPGDYTTRSLASEDDLVDAVRDRDVVGGLVVTPDGVRAVVASAGSTAISGTLSATAGGVAASLGLPVEVTDVVPLPADDPTGIGVGGLAFPLVFGGIVPVVAFGTAFAGRHRWRLTGILGFSAVGGTVVAAVLQLWFGSVTSVFVPVAGAMALGIAALALPLAGLQQLLGTKGFTAGAMVMMFLGNPLAGIATTGAWLPAGLGAFGQLLPPGATGALVRSVAYFDGAGALAPLATLTAWALVGAGLNALAVRRTRRGATEA
ncbi:MULTISPECIES: hypothetical protein [unclassified Actinotalea]|uniref:hypothetical protein n=1 Tax=unclassified Actinotalea TaxID=2638618 RepID=UPI001C70CAD7|nr:MULTISPECIES: hypothetical protein [unclassified Actinotalea]